MDYDEAREVFFQPRETTRDQLRWHSRARALRDAIEPIAAICWWSEPAYDQYASLGLDFLTGYVWSRACVMGEPDAGVVAATFGVFEPAALAGLYGAAREACGLAEIRRARESGATAALRQILGDPSGLTDVLASLRRGAAAADVLSRPLFAGLAGMAAPEDELGQLWHVCAMLRECRGDSHLAALVSAGLGGLEANIITELWVGYELTEYSATRAWSPEAIERATAGLRARGLIADGSLTDAGKTLRETLEQATDATMAPVLAAIGGDLDGVLEAAGAWSTQIIDAGSFPPDPFKRASG
jgi:hypothetical protein